MILQGARRDVSAEASLLVILEREIGLAPVVQHRIRRLDVPVHEAVAIGIVERTSKLPQISPHRLQWSGHISRLTELADECAATEIRQHYIMQDGHVIFAGGAFSEDADEAIAADDMVKQAGRTLNTSSQTSPHPSGCLKVKRATNRAISS